MRLTEWTCTETVPDLVDDPSKLDSLDLEWVPFEAPGTVAAALGRAGRWSIDDDRDLDDADWWIRCSFARPDLDAPLGWELCFDGLATLAEVWLNGASVLTSSNMFRSHRVDVSGQLAADNDLVIRCSSLAAALGAKRPRPRWKTNLVDHQNLRWFRTTLHGRRPTWTGSCAPVGPWRAVTLRPRAAVGLAAAVLDARPADDGGRIDVDVRLDSTVPVQGVTLVVAGSRTALDRVGPDGATRFAGAASVPGVEAWWPATHGAQPRYDAVLDVEVDGGSVEVPLGRVGFRTVELAPADAPVLRVNGIEVFARGVVWVPADPIGLAPSPDDLRRALEQLRDAGMNLVRVPGTAVYESREFLDLCDELGLLVWHDLMFARMDYPVDDEDFAAEVRAEVGEITGALAGHPCVAVVCGGSEIGQQAAMIGRPVPSEELVGAAVGDLVAAGLPGVPYVIDVPIGGTHPFTVDTGIANYFGVGGYRRPVSDARLCGVRFAAESLAFSNVPDDAAVDELLTGGVALHDPRWKAGIARDRGTPWDFEDVRDHYVRELYGVDPAEVRAVDADRYLDLGRAATAAVAAEAMSQWRRSDSSCGGALVLEGRDVRPGAGPGIVDSTGRPKAIYHALRRVLAPVALFVSDEGMNGLDAWAVNDTPVDQAGTLTVAVFVDQSRTARVDHPLAIAPRTQHRMRVEELLGSFSDLTYAFRFGAQAATCVALHWHDGDRTLARAVFRPGRPPTERGDLGLAGRVVASDGERHLVEVSTERYAHCVRIEARGAALSDDGFDLEPGGSLVVDVVTDRPLRARVRALNAAASSPIMKEHG